MMRRRTFAALVLAQGLYTAWAWACSCVEPDVDAIAAGDATLVVATIERVRGTGQRGCQRSSAAPTYFTVAVEEDLRGVIEVGSAREFETVVDGASCGIGGALAEGARWLLHTDDGFVSLCSLSHELPADGDSPRLAELRQALAGR